MSKIEGIKDFIEANKESLEKMNQEMIASYGQVPLVWLTVEEACEILDYLSYLHLRGGRDSFLKDLEKCNRNLYERIEQAEGKL